MPVNDGKDWLMILKPRQTLCVLLVLAAGVGAPAADAQTTPSSPAPAAQPDRRVVARVEARIAEMHAKLHITSAQQPQWDAFTAVMRENAQHTEQVIAARGAANTATALDEMRGYTAMASAHATDMQKMLPVFEALYNSFSPEQQKQADAVFREQRRRLR